VVVEREKWRFWTVPLVILAFWVPITVLGQPDFNPMLFLTSEYGLAFCFTAPVMICLLSLYYPNIYKPAYRFLCIVDVYIGLLNLAGPWILSGYPIWVAIFYIPLVTISMYGLTLEKNQNQGVFNTLRVNKIGFFHKNRFDLVFLVQKEGI
jgi:hypothetical protein